MCSSWRLNHPATRSRTGGINESAATTTAATPAPTSHQIHQGADAATGAQVGREACSICFLNSAVIDADRNNDDWDDDWLTGDIVEAAGSRWLLTSFRSATISRQLW